jgi:hypothetical protein
MPRPAPLSTPQHRLSGVFTGRFVIRRAAQPGSQLAAIRSMKRPTARRIAATIIRSFALGLDAPPRRDVRKRAIYRLTRALTVHAGRGIVTG